MGSLRRKAWSLAPVGLVVALSAFSDGNDLPMAANQRVASPPPVVRMPTTVEVVVSPAAVSAGLDTTPSTTIEAVTALSQPSPSVVYRYRVATKGRVISDVGEFAAQVAATLQDPRGWALDHSVAFAEVPNGGDFTIWLATPDQMRGFDRICSARYSCQSGRNVVVNEERWLRGGFLTMELDDYRTQVVNHEVGHWLGLSHSSCPGRGQPAHVMQQQSKGGTFLGPCQPSAWPDAGERKVVGKRLGLTGLAPVPDG